MNLLMTILMHMREPFSYLPAGMAGAMVGMIPVCIIFYRKKELTLLRVLWWYSLLTYLAVVVIMTFLSREPGSRQGIDLQFLSTWGNSVESKAYVLENIFLFLPFGVLRALRKHPVGRHPWLTEAGLYLSVSCLIEGSQLLTGRGYCQLDDVIMNTLGGITGYILCQPIFRIGRKNVSGGSKRAGRALQSGTESRGSSVRKKRKAVRIDG